MSGLCELERLSVSRCSGSLPPPSPLLLPSSSPPHLTCCVLYCRTLMLARLERSQRAASLLQTERLPPQVQQSSRSFPAFENFRESSYPQPLRRGHNWVHAHVEASLHDSTMPPPPPCGCGERLSLPKRSRVKSNTTHVICLQRNGIWTLGSCSRPPSVSGCCGVAEAIEW